MSQQAVAAKDDSSTWVRSGAVRLLQGGKWKRKNGPVACDSCRKRRVRCSGFETGAPCDPCRRREVACIVGDDSYPHDAPTQTILFIPILPPPAVPCPSPSQDDKADATGPLDLSALSEALETAGPRPAPLVWKTLPEELLLPTAGSATTTTRQREKRAAPAPSSSTKKPKYTFSSSSSSSSDDGNEALAPPPVPTHRPTSSVTCRKPRPPLHYPSSSLSRQNPAPPAPVEQVVFDAALALFSLRKDGGEGGEKRGLVSVKQWKESGREERGWQMGQFAGENTPTLGFSLSTARADPLPLPLTLPSAPLSLPFHPASPLSFLPSDPALYSVNTAGIRSGSNQSSASGSGVSSSYHSRRASLISDSSSNSDGSSGSATTVASSVLELEEGKEEKMVG
ncbi:hypothetical protein JCM8547_009307 [Rhodosporidiobolus lusitaniae]